MNDEVMNKCFPEQMKLRKEKRCPFCGRPVSMDFKDELSKKEFEKSGLCQSCQDMMFDGIIP